MHRTLAIVLTTLVLVGAGCSNWKTYGKVDMKKLVSLEEIWANKDKYIGTVVTVQWDDYYLMKLGTTNPLGQDSLVHYALKYYINGRGYKTHEEFKSATPALVEEAIANGDSILPDDYFVQVLYDAHGKVHVPNWADYKGKWYNMTMGRPGTDRRTFEAGSPRILCGVLMDVQKSRSLGDIYSRAISILPIGYRVPREN